MRSDWLLTIRRVPAATIRWYICRKHLTIDTIDTTECSCIIYRITRALFFLPSPLGKTCHLLLNQSAVSTTIVTCCCLLFPFTPVKELVISIAFRQCYQQPLPQQVYFYRHIAFLCNRKLCRKILCEILSCSPLSYALLLTLKESIQFTIFAEFLLTTRAKCGNLEIGWRNKMYLLYKSLKIKTRFK